MFVSHALSPFVAAISLTVTALGTGSTTCPNGSTHVPAFVVTAAASTVADFASALAEARACAGFFVRGQEHTEISRAWRYDRKEPSHTLEEAFRVFAERHPNFSLQHTNGAWIVREKQIDLDSGVLATRIESFQVTHTRAIDAIRLAVARFVPGLQPAGGLVASRMGHPGDKPFSADEMLGPFINVATTNAGLPKILDEIGRAAPGVIWVVAQLPAKLPDVAVEYQVRTFLRGGMQQPIEGVIR